MRLVAGRICLRFLVLGCAVAVGSSGGCQQKSWAGLQSSNPVERSEAIIRVAEARDYEAVPALIDRLEDDDRAVRMYAAVALRDLVGEDFGYRYYGPAAERAGAVEAWREALRAGTIKARGERPGESLVPPERDERLSRRAGIALPSEKLGGSLALPERAEIALPADEVAPVSELSP